MKNNFILRISLLAIVAMVTTSKSVAQFDPMFTQYMFNEMFINPAYAGSRETLSATGLLREQWVGLDGAPSTQTFSIHGPLMQQKLGIGLSVLNEGIGVNKRTAFNLNGAYRIKMEKAVLAFGLQAGMVLLSEDLAKLNLQSDQQFQVSTGTRTAPNFGFGVYYNTPKFYAGLSIPRMIQNRLDFQNGSALVQNKFNAKDFHYYITAGTIHNLTSSVKLRPSLMLKTVSGAPIQADISVNALFNDFIWAGLGYRSGDAASLLVGAYLTKQLRLGYAYDYSMSALQDFNTGSHEIMLGYDFNYDKDKIVTPRYF